jgi:hypothetical protein
MTKEIGRLAMREEGNVWIAYWAMPGTIRGAVKLGEIAMDIVQDESRKQAFMDIFKSYIADSLERNLGTRPSLFETQPAPESERS